MDILWIFFRWILDFLGGLPSPISMFIIRLGIWFVVSYSFALVGFGKIMEYPMMERPMPFCVFGLSSLIAFLFPLGWVRYGGRFIGFLDILFLLAIIALPREIPGMVFRRFGYQITLARLFYWGAAMLALIQVAYIK